MENRMTKSFVIKDDNVEQYATTIAGWIAQQVQGANRKGVVLGMSGGIDSSVVACLCHLAQVDTYLVMMPYGNDMSNSQSYQHALELIDKFNFPYHIYDIQPAADALKITDESFLAKADVANVGLSLANIRPRVRMTYLYQLAQLGSRFVIGTGNMAEGTVGYFTKWGDGAVDLNPLGRLTKQEVYTLAKFLGVPDAIIHKKPSAGLWEGQTDEDELGMSYAQIDAFILNGSSGDADIDAKIKQRYALSAHKFAPVPIFTD
ncbi:NAD(+) synthase [Sphingobacterium paludis]|uniref:NH(3)-dependent NAD(+) synthetase n=1 Tax=Sphingobacterium paludis TaxID=1476465 RepID=A0A4R7CV57_9SPHI|nr:NAD(+) synthase [Sphingobacterium paludis]TDS11737.1 NH(3)-dependent NAD(+) synthetase [Sphingobacterium paludis]